MKVAKILLEAKAVSLNAGKPFRFASGILSPIYCDNRLLISDVSFRNKIVNNFLKIIKNKKVDVIAGTATAGIPWAAWIAAKLKKPMVYVRGKSKDHGKENKIEGKLKKGQKVIVIEDLISTGGSSINAVKAVRKAGGKVEYCLAIFSYQMKKAEEYFRKEKCKLVTLSNFEELVKVAKRMKYINKKEKKLILEWNKDPEKWGR